MDKFKKVFGASKIQYSFRTGLPPEKIFYSKYWLKIFDVKALPKKNYF